jgi:hypothetical protein
MLNLKLCDVFIKGVFLLTLNIIQKKKRTFEKQGVEIFAPKKNRE